MKIKTSELTGAALDWAVAKCEYDELAAKVIQYPQYSKHYPKIEPSTPTPLIAAMRCFVASKIGEEVNVPDELVKGETK